MGYRGIIFDFNGTLFWDSDMQEEAWNAFARKLKNREMSDGEMKQVMHGRTNKSVMEYLLGAPVEETKLLELIQEKESIYRGICLRNHERFSLAPGAAELLDYLSERGIPRTIATASEITNLRFFIESFGLEKWFDVASIVYDNGNLPGKPEPDVYIEAAGRLGLEPEHCVVAEDSVSGVEAARRADIGKIIVIGDKSREEILKYTDRIDCVINSFDEFDRSLFE